jgi:NitT/TauT family transport system substrate-binding protein
MLLGSQVQAATLPEPLAAIAMGRGARLLLSDADSDVSLSQTVFVFRRPVLAERKGEVAAFFTALGRAVRMINHEPERFRPLFVDKGRIPADLAATYPIPAYPEPAPFPRELYTPVSDWLAERRLTPPLAYEQLVDQDFLGRDE